MKQYGNENTHLYLTGKALKFYNMSSDLRIMEEQTENGYQYLVTDDNKHPLHDGMMTEEYLIQWLEDGLDEYLSCQTFRIKPEYIDLWGSEATEDTVLDYETVKRLAEDWEKPIEDILSQLETD